MHAERHISTSTKNPHQKKGKFSCRADISGVLDTMPPADITGSHRQQHALREKKRPFKVQVATHQQKACAMGQRYSKETTAKETKMDGNPCFCHPSLQTMGHGLWPKKKKRMHSFNFPCVQKKGDTIIQIHKSFSASLRNATLNKSSCLKERKKKDKQSTQLVTAFSYAESKLKKGLKDFVEWQDSAIHSVHPLELQLAQDLQSKLLIHSRRTWG